MKADTKLTIRISMEQLSEIKQVAYKKGITISALIRWLLIDFAEKHKNDGTNTKTEN